MKITIIGHPMVLKNSKQIIVVNGRRLIKSNPKVEAFQHKAIQEIVEQIGTFHEAISGKIHIRMLFYGAWKKDTNAPDLDNLLCLPLDLLAAAGVIEDDSMVESFDGTRRVRLCETCEDRPVFKAGARKGEYKEDCSAVKKCRKEMTEIFIEGM